MRALLVCLAFLCSAAAADLAQLAARETAAAQAAQEESRARIAYERAALTARIMELENALRGARTQRDESQRRLDPVGKQEQLQLQQLQRSLAEAGPMEARALALPVRGVERVAVIGEDGVSREQAVLRLGAVAAWLVDTAQQVRQDDVLWRVVGLAGDARARQAVAALAQGQPASLALIPQSERLPALLPGDSGSWLARGGPFVWPILGVAILAFLLCVERVLTLWRLRAPRGLLHRVLSLSAQDPAAAKALCVGTDPLSQVLQAGLSCAGHDREQHSAQLEAAILALEGPLERSLSLLASLAAVAPLLGLLGTVSGMISTFQVMSAHGAGEARLLAGGISEALITTQLGLLVAVPVLLAHAALARAVDRRFLVLDQASAALLGERARA